MKQMESKTVEVHLTVLGEVDVLIFNLDDNSPEKYYINLNNHDSQTQIKEVFAKLLEMLLESDLSLELRIAEGYSKGLYKDVCKEYISDLNKEIAQTKELIIKELE